MAGQSVGLMDEVKPIKAIFEELLEEGENTLREVSDKLKAE